ncbi:hypothetical protein PYCCODRAFT_1440446 [Trametes coccinea BRFM310]|uniref:Uncharacterized protein n=1 Tax=Trametes coccinea (strain BRFM310) TaxID=1353009 RepID=A0A1Y2I9V0_TRAC3|nr:hypothetical protein PYCCODRAFT_1440446 [Trametes coccinea BRFM310]
MRFRKKITDDDRKADFSYHDQRVVRCSRCLRTVTMRSANDTERWREHRRSKRCVDAKGSQQFITQFFRRGPPAPVESSPARTKRPGSSGTSAAACPGLSFSQDARIPDYLSRTVVPSGGAPRRDVLRLEIIRDHARARATRGKLSQKQLTLRVLAQERAQAKWLNHHTTGTVTAAKCQKVARISANGDISPCSECTKLLRLKTFTNALRKRRPKVENAKYTPKAYRNPVAGEAYLRHRDVQGLMEMVRTAEQYKRCPQG